MAEEAIVWVFNGSGRRSPNFPSGVFSELEKAEEWIQRNHVSGTLTQYPLNIGVYDWTLEHEFFRPSKDDHYSPAFIGAFSDASQEHYHYENGGRIS